MRHATPELLDQLEPLLAGLRGIEGLTEKKRGVFYRRSRAFIHFHEDPAGPFADVRFGDEFERLRVKTQAERRSLLSRVRQTLETRT